VAGKVLRGGILIHQGIEREGFKKLIKAEGGKAAGWKKISTSKFLTKQMIFAGKKPTVA